MPYVHIILRHTAENLSKCSLEPLRGRPDLKFIEASAGTEVVGTGYILLEVGAPLLSAADAGHPLLILDGNWKHVAALRRRVTGTPTPRSLPPIPTAYPRRSADNSDPLVGLASVEALYLARRMMGEDDLTLLSHYRWRDAFLAGINL
jgi:pre-rRNA-processing protein TSR3